MYRLLYLCCILVFLAEEANASILDKIYLPVTSEIQAGFAARPDVLQYWHNEIVSKGFTKIAEFGPGGVERMFPHANIVIDHLTTQFEGITNVSTFELDIDLDRVPVEDGAFDLVYSRHLMEDINNPVGAFREMVRLSKRGYIETPSPFIESLILGFGEVDIQLGATGYPHHRFLFWTDTATNTLIALPKYPLISAIPYDHRVLESWLAVLQADTVYMNNYYHWDIDNGLLPKIVLLKHSVDFSIHVVSSYGETIARGAQLSVQHTTDFFKSFVHSPILNVEVGIIT